MGLARLTVTLTMSNTAVHACLNASAHTRRYTVFVAAALLSGSEVGRLVPSVSGFVLALSFPTHLVLILPSPPSLVVP